VELRVEPESALEQARLDWKHGRFPAIPGDDDERVPGPGE
jgi:hypothetical protein